MQRQLLVSLGQQLKRKQKCKKTVPAKGGNGPDSTNTEYNRIMNPSYDVKLTTASSPFLVH